MSTVPNQVSDIYVKTMPYWINMSKLFPNIKAKEVTLDSPNTWDVTKVKKVARIVAKRSNEL